MEKGKQTNKLPKGWIWTTIGEIGIVQSGGTPSTRNQEFWGDEISWITPADLSGYNEKYISKGNRSLSKIGLDYSSAKLLPKGTILFSSRAPIGYTVIAKNELATNQGFKNLIPTKSLNSEYVYYYFQTLKSQAEKVASGTTFLELSAIKFSLLPFPLAPLKEQQRIVSKIESLFSELDEVEKGLQKAKQQLEVYRQSLLKSAFDGKLTEQWRNENDSEPIERLQNSINEMRRKQFKDEITIWEIAFDEWKKNGGNGKKPFKPKEPYKAPLISNKESKELAYIPKGWKWVKTSQIISVINNGYTPKSEFLNEGSGEIPFIKVYNLTFNGELDFSINPTFIPKEIHQSELKRSICKPGDVLINIVGPPLGKVSIVPEIYSEWNINQAIVLFRPNDYISSKYISFFMQSSSTIQWLSSTSIGTAGQRNVKVSTCRQIPIPLCSVNEQEKIVEILESMLSIKENLEKNIDSSIQASKVLRQSILKKAFDGKLVVQDSSNEPASNLLKQIKGEKETYLKRQIDSQKNAPIKFKKMSKLLSIQEILKGSTEPMSAKEVWQKSIHKDNIEEFYAELKQLGDKVKEVKIGLDSLLSLKQ